MSNKPQTLKVLANGMAMVTDLDALKAGVRRYVGRAYDQTLGDAGGWVPQTSPQDVPNYADYRRAVKEGDLIPADATTAALCGVALPAVKQSK